MTTGPIYEMIADLDYVGLTFVDAENFVFPRETWMGVLQRRAPVFDVELNDENADPQTEIVPDFVDFSLGYCCARKAAWSLLVASLKVRGPTVSLNLVERNEEFVLFEPLPEIDCLDFDRSDVQYFEGSDSVQDVDNVVLRNTGIVDVDIFRLRHLGATLFCTDACRRIVNENALTGLIFKPVPVVS
jgi:hypothetical protein